jgi:hypothetical protein
MPRVALTRLGPRPSRREDKHRANNCTTARSFRVRARMSKDHVQVRGPGRELCPEQMVAARAHERNGSALLAFSHVARF